MHGEAHGGPLRVGITGGIASGKSTVCDAFAHLGVPVVDTDVLAREVVRPGTAGLAAIVDAFGARVLREDGTLDRDLLRDIVFSSIDARRRLEGLLHPLILAATDREVARITAPYCLIAIPLLAETGAQDRVDRVLVVDCPPEQQIERLMARDGEDEAGARRILAAQATREQRLALADDVIVNDATRDALAPQVSRLHQQYLALAG